MKNTRSWEDLLQRHKAFWDCEETDRPLVAVVHEAYVDTELVARVLGEGELQPEAIDPTPILPEFERMAVAHEAVGDDFIVVAEPLLGIPWLEAICGCQVRIPDSKSVWPEPPEGIATVENISFSENNPWFQKLLEVIQRVVDDAQGRYPVGLSHLRGPTDILIALLGSEQFFMGFVDDTERLKRLANQAAEVWLEVAKAQTRIVKAYRGGYPVRQFGIWAPARTAWLQDDTSGMMSLDHYRQLFLEAIQRMSIFPYGVLHLHIPSLHLATTLAEVPNVRAINFYFDSPSISLQDAMPTLRRLQERKMPLILAKDVYQGFSLEEYKEICDGLSPAGLSVHLKGDSLEEGQAVMAQVRGEG
jgi:hypothetical protein